jgi:hypothetical protein
MALDFSVQPHTTRVSRNIFNLPDESFAGTKAFAPGAQTAAAASAARAREHREEKIMVWDSIVVLIRGSVC